MKRMEDYKRSIGEEYLEAINKKEHEKEAWKEEMKLRAEERQKLIELEHQKQLAKLAEKREEQAKYRDMLDVQVVVSDQRFENNQKTLNRNKMTVAEKKVNYDDLQVDCRLRPRNTRAMAKRSIPTRFRASRRQ